MVEWQDVLDKEVTIIDSDGNIYVWDDSKKAEYSTIYGYTMKVIGTNVDLANKCYTIFKKMNCTNEFLFVE